MIHGVGVDICDNSRIKDLLSKYEERFLSRVFTEEEKRYCMKKSNPAPYLAARFAFKEAFFKALNPSLDISFQEVGLSGEGGKKEVYTSSAVKEFLQKLAIDNVQFSISHERHYSIAMVVLEKAGVKNIKD